MSKLSWKTGQFFLAAGWLISLFIFVSTSLTLALYLSADLSKNSHSEEWLEFYVPSHARNSPALDELIDDEQKQTKVRNVRIVYVTFPDTAIDGKNTKCPAAADAPALTSVDVRLVRVNKLANLEELLNLETNLGEIIAIARGLFLLAAALMSGKRKSKPLALGLILIVIGLAIPGIINWIIANARDADLFK